MPATPAAVAAYLRLPTPSADDDLLASVCDAVNEYAATLPWVAQAAADTGGSWPKRAEQGAVMHAARVFRRRNTPAGVEAMNDSVVYVARQDSDVAQLLRIGPYQMPAVG